MNIFLCIVARFFPEMIDTETVSVLEIFLFCFVQSCSMVTFSKLNNRQRSVWTWVWTLDNILIFCVSLIKCKKPLFPELIILSLFWRNCGSLGITSNYSDLDTERLKCLGSNRALSFTVPSASDTVNDLDRLETEERIKCVYVFLAGFFKPLLNLANY